MTALREYMNIYLFERLQSREIPASPAKVPRKRRACDDPTMWPRPLFCLHLMPRQHFQDVEQAALQQVACEATGLSRLGLNQWCGEVAACHAGASLSYTRVLYLGSGYLESGAANCLVGLVAGTEIFLFSTMV